MSTTSSAKYAYRGSSGLNKPSTSTILILLVRYSDAIARNLLTKICNLNPSSAVKKATVWNHHRCGKLQHSLHPCHCENSYTVPSIQLDICAHYVRSVTSVVPHETADAVPHTGNLTQIRQDKFVNVVGILKMEICIQSERVLQEQTLDNKFCCAFLHTHSTLRSFQPAQSEWIPAIIIIWSICICWYVQMWTVSHYLPETEMIL